MEEGVRDGVPKREGAGEEEKEEKSPPVGVEVAKRVGCGEGACAAERRGEGRRLGWMRGGEEEEEEEDNDDERCDLCFFSRFSASENGLEEIPKRWRDDKKADFAI